MEGSGWLIFRGKISTIAPLDLGRLADAPRAGKPEDGDHVPERRHDEARLPGG
jgi:hypothetical protein